MAIVNIIAQSTYSINWENILHRYSALALNHVEIFPIPQELGFEQDSIGINVHRGYPNKEVVISELKKIIDFFISFDLKFVELYYGIEISSSNIETIAERLLT
jgi:hypothetical protein